MSSPSKKLPIGHTLWARQNVSPILINEVEPREDRLFIKGTDEERLSVETTIEERDIDAIVPPDSLHSWEFTRSLQLAMRHERLDLFSPRDHRFHGQGFHLASIGPRRKMTRHIVVYPCQKEATKITLTDAQIQTLNSRDDALLAIVDPHEYWVYGAVTKIPWRAAADALDAHGQLQIDDLNQYTQDLRTGFDIILKDHALPPDQIDPSSGARVDFRAISTTALRFDFYTYCNAHELPTHTLPLLSKEFIHTGRIDGTTTEKWLTFTPIQRRLGHNPYEPDSLYFAAFRQLFLDLYDKDVPDGIHFDEWEERWQKEVYPDLDIWVPLITDIHQAMEYRPQVYP